MQAKYLSKRFTFSAMLMTVSGIILIVLTPALAFALTQAEAKSAAQASAKTGEVPLYDIPVKDAQIRRRVAGGSDIKRGLPRGLPRGVPRGLPRGISRGLPRGLPRGISRGLPRGLPRGISRGLPRGLPRGVPRGLPRGEAKQVAQTGGDQSHQVGMTSSSMPSYMAPLASERTGLTIKSQPVLYWYTSGPWPGQIEFTLNEPRASEPVLRTHIDGPAKEGISQLALAEFNISLKPGVEYEWFIAIVSDPKERSGDFLGSATIKYVKSPTDLSNRLKKIPKNVKHHAYAREGYWYDAIEHLSKMIDATQGNAKLRNHRGALLGQVNLVKVAAYDLEKR